MTTKSNLVQKVVLALKQWFSSLIHNICITMVSLCVAAMKISHFCQLVNNVEHLHFCCISVKHVELFIAFPKITVHGNLSAQ